MSTHMFQIRDILGSQQLHLQLKTLSISINQTKKYLHKRYTNGTDGLLTSLRRSWRLLDAGDAVKVEINGGGG